jgi:hypothetical protein
MRLSRDGIPQPIEEMTKTISPKRGRVSISTVGLIVTIRGWMSQGLTHGFDVLFNVEDPDGGSPFLLGDAE